MNSTVAGVAWSSSRIPMGCFWNKAHVVGLEETEGETLPPGFLFSLSAINLVSSAILGHMSYSRAFEFVFPAAELAPYAERVSYTFRTDHVVASHPCRTLLRLFTQFESELDLLHRMARQRIRTRTGGIIIRLSPAET